MLCFPIPSTLSSRLTLAWRVPAKACKVFKLRGDEKCENAFSTTWNETVLRTTDSDHNIHWFMSANMCAPTNKKDLDPDALYFTFTSGARPSAPAKSVKCSLRLHATLQRWLHSRLTLWILRLCLQFSPCGALSIHKLRNAAACISCRSSDPLPVTRCRILCR